MEYLVLLLLVPTVFAESYVKSPNPNDEPFLPIYPVYPYNPKLIKRGTDGESVTHLTPELYAPKLDARDSYTASYGGNYQRDPYYPSYNPYPKSSLASAYSSYFGNNSPYPYTSNPYSLYNSYSTPYPATPSPYPATPSPYPAAPYPPANYPNYYYQQPYYYPGYYPPAPPHPPPPPSDYSKDDSPDSDTDDKKSDDKKSKKSKSKDTDSEFVDGGNYITTNSKDLEGQSSSYKSPNLYNQLDLSDIKNIQITPKTAYRVVSIAGQPMNPDYPLQASFVKAQQLEQLMSQTLAKLLAQNAAQQAAIQQYSVYEPNQNQNVAKGNTALPFVNLPTVISKSGDTYVLKPAVLTKINTAQLSPGHTLQNPISLSKLAQLLRKQPASVTVQESPGVYIPPKIEKNTVTDYNNAYDSPNQEYENSNQSENYPKYETNTEGQRVSYGKQNFVTLQTPPSQTYRYANYHPGQSSTPQSQQIKTNLEDVNFGAKQNRKV